MRELQRRNFYQHVDDTCHRDVGPRCFPGVIPAIFPHSVITLKALIRLTNESP
jgi:hypothetical protein